MNDDSNIFNPESSRSPTKTHRLFTIALADFKGFRKFVKQYNLLATFILPFPIGADNYDLALLYFRWTYFPTGSPSINETSEYFEARKDPNTQAEKASVNLSQGTMATSQSRSIIGFSP